MRFTNVVFLVQISPSSNEHIQQREVENWMSQIENFIRRRLLQNNNVDAQVDVAVHPQLTKEE